MWYWYLLAFWIGACVGARVGIYLYKDELNKQVQRLALLQLNKQTEDFFDEKKDIDEMKTL